MKNNFQKKTEDKIKIHEERLLNIADVDPNDAIQEAQAMVLAASKIAIIILNKEFGKGSVDELIKLFNLNFDKFKEVARKMRLASGEEK